MTKMSDCIYTPCLATQKLGCKHFLIGMHGVWARAGHAERVCQP